MVEEVASDLQRSLARDPAKRKLLSLICRVGFVGVGLLLTGLATKKATQVVSYIPSKEAVDFAPDWMKSSRSFLNNINGPGEWLEDVLFSNPIIKDSTKALIDYQLEARDLYKRLDLGEIYIKSLQIVEERLQEESFVDANYRVTHLPETIRIASIIAAAPILTFKSESIFKKLGFSFGDCSTFEEFYWGPEGYGTWVMPQLFGEDDPSSDRKYAAANQEPRIGGADRATHALSHAMLSTVYGYSRTHLLAEHQTIPQGLKWLSALIGKGDVDKESIVFSLAAGIAYEVLSTKGNLPLLNYLDRNQIPSGLFDIRAREDLKADYLGAQIGSQLLRLGLQGISLPEIYERLVRLNGNIYRYRDASPKVDLLTA